MRNEVKLYSSLKVAVLTVCAICLCALTVKAQETDVYYSNDLGLELTEEEYKYATQYMDSVELEFFSQDELAAILRRTKRPCEAEQLFMKAQRAIGELAQKVPDTFEIDLGVSYHLLSNLLVD